MTSGDEPQLGGKLSDDAPMISSVETRAIASARGAYLAGNLNGLLDLLNPDQAARFRRAVVRQALLVARPVLEVSGQGPEREALAMVARWLDRPTQGGELAIRALAADFNATIRRVLPLWGIRMERLIAYFLARSASADSGLAANGARRVVQLVAEHRRQQAPAQAAQAGHPTPRAAVEAAMRWQVEAAWAILQGREPPEAA
jgi:hypothetical protein